MNDQEINELLEAKQRLDAARQDFMDAARKFADCRCESYRLFVEVSTRKLMQISDEVAALRRGR